MALRTTELFRFIKERHSIYTNKKAGLPKPWTDDPILQNYRFCNVYRELDKVTAWIGRNWREPHWDDPDMWFAMAVARFFNNIETLESLGWPVVFTPVNALANLHLRKSKGLRVFNPAYIVSTCGKSMDKIDYVVDEVLTPLWDSRGSIQPREGDTLNSFFWRLKAYNGLSNFMAAQIVADAKFAGVLFKASDWWTFAASGPGSKRGLNRVYGWDPNDTWFEETWRARLAELKVEIDLSIKAADMPMLSAQDLQNCLCEFDKYERVRRSEGKPKQRYAGV